MKNHSLLLAAAFAACVLAGAPATADTGRPVTIDDVMRLRIVGAVTPEPAGNGFVVQVATWDGGQRFLRDLWHLAPGGALRPLTTGGTGGGSHAFSPDGGLLAFTGVRNGVQGIHVLPMAGGEARTLAALAVPADNVRWAGESLFFTAAVFPDCGADLACTERRHAERAKGTSAMVYETLYHRPWNTWADGTHNALFRLDPASGKVDVVAAGTFDVPPVPFGGREDYDVSSDGRVVVYAAKKVADPWQSTNDDLFEVVDGVERRLTDNPASDRAPRLSPDGSRVAYLAQAVPGFESDRIRLKILDRKTGDIITVGDAIRNWITEFAWTPDGGALIAIAEEEGHLLPYRVEARKGGAVRRLGGRFVYRHPIVARDGKSVVFTRETLVAPADLYRMDLKSGTETRLTDLNAEALKGLAMPRVEEIWWDGAEVAPGKRQRVHGFLVVPPEATQATPAPLVVFVHGGPQGAFLNAHHPRWNALPVAGQGYVVAMPNPTGSVGYGQEFVNAVSRDWGGKPYQDIMAMVEVLSARPDVDGERVCAMGGSYGGYMANWMEAKSGDRFKCLISHAGPSALEVKYGTTDELWFPEWDIGGAPWDDPETYRKWSPITYAKDFRTPMMVIHGANDFRVSLEQGLVMYQFLKKRGVEAKLVVFPDEDHFVNRPVNRRFWYDTVNAWLGRYLKAR
jgi:dipeptidyl aminopeptidase/acylaminoacyl peptidase